MNKQYVYIVTHTVDVEGSLKVGRSHSNPHVRATRIAPQAKGKFEVEWYIEVVDCRAAEKHAHALLAPYKCEKEYFNLALLDAVKILKSGLKSFVGLDKPYYYEGPRLRELILEKSVERQAKRLLRELERDKTLLDNAPLKTQSITDHSDTYAVIRRLDALILSTPTGWKTDVASSLEDIPHRHLEVIAGKLTSAYYAISYSGDAPIPNQLWALKWRGYFWHVLLVQVVLDIQDQGPIAKAKNQRTLTAFVNHVNKQYQTQPLNEHFAGKPLVTSGVEIVLLRSSKKVPTIVRTKTTIPVYQNLSEIEQRRAKALMDADDFWALPDVH